MATRRLLTFKPDLGIVLFGIQKHWKTYKQLLTDEHSTNQFHSFEQCCNTISLDGLLSIIENVYKRAAKETGLTKTEPTQYLSYNR